MSLFGKPAGGTSLFGQTSSTPFGASTTNTQQQQQQQPTQSLGLFGQSAANANNQQQQQQQQQPQQAAPLGQSFLGQQQNNPAGGLGFQPGATTYSEFMIFLINKLLSYHPCLVSLLILE